jgi:hypothetical protein
VDIQPILSAIGPISASTKWPKLVRNAHYATLPTYSPTRWYSMWKLIRNALALRNEIDAFLASLPADASHEGAIPEAAWASADALLPVLETFKNASQILESDTFGSRSHIFEAYQMLEMVIEQQQPLYAPLEQGWRKAKLHWNKHFSQPIVKMSAMMATMLNPGVLFNRCVTPQDSTAAVDSLSRIFRETQGSHPLEPSRAHVEKKDTRMRARAITRDYLLGTREECDELRAYLAIDRRFLS